MPVQIIGITKRDIRVDDAHESIKVAVKHARKRKKTEWGFITWGQWLTALKHMCAAIGQES